MNHSRTTPASRLTAICTSIVLLAGWDCVGATINAVDTSYAAVSNAVKQASSGDTVSVPAGTSSWTETLLITNDIQLIGAGIDQTIIVDGQATANELIHWMTSSNHSDRLSGITFLGTTNTAITYGGTVLIDGTCHAMRVDHVKFDTLQSQYNLFFTGWIYGVVDHCIWNINGGGGMELGHETYGGNSYGDGSWADSDSWGTTNAIYIENCSFANFVDPSPGGHGALDSQNGVRFVFRNNYLTNCLIGTHGSESGGRLRSVRTCEIYNNYFLWQTNVYNGNVWIGFVPFCIYLRGGTATIYSNTVIGGIQYLAIMAEYREYPNDFGTWGNITGVNPWDSNNPTLFASGHATATNNIYPIASITDSNKNFTINQFTNYYLYNTNLGFGFVISSNSVNTLYFSIYSPYAGTNRDGTGTDGLVHWLLNDGYQIHQVYAAVDQCGRGQGDLISGDTPTPAWPHQASDPVYIWGNSLAMLIPGNANNNHGNSQSAIIQNGRDWFDEVTRPAYTPLVYPHPLTVTATAYTGPVLYNPILRFN